MESRIRLTDPERISLAAVAKGLGRKALEEVAQIVRPETILAGCRYLLHDRNAKLCEAFIGILEAVGIRPVRCPSVVQEPRGS